MGQQQLLLIILVTIIVGITSIVAMNIVSVGSVQANRDAVRQDLSASASYVQTVWERPEHMGGASKEFGNLEESEILRLINIPASEYNEGGTKVRNENGTFSTEIISDTELSVTGVPKSGPPNIQVIVSRLDDASQWAIEFSEVSESGSSSRGGPQRGTDSQRRNRR